MNKYLVFVLIIMMGTFISTYTLVDNTPSPEDSQTALEILNFIENMCYRGMPEGIGVYVRNHQDTIRYMIRHMDLFIRKYPHHEVTKKFTILLGGLRNEMARHGL